MQWCRPKKCFAGDFFSVHFSFKNYKDYFFYRDGNKFFVFIGDRDNTKDIRKNYIQFTEEEFEQKFNSYVYGDI